MPFDAQQDDSELDWEEERPLRGKRLLRVGVEPGVPIVSIDRIHQRLEIEDGLSVERIGHMQVTVPFEGSALCLCQLVVEVCLAKHGRFIPGRPVIVGLPAQWFNARVRAALHYNPVCLTVVT